jgi:hypothetical protein
MACTGNQSTIGDGATWAGVVTRIGGVSLNRAGLDNSDLSTADYATMCQGDLITIDPLDVDLLWDASATGLPPIEAAEATWTITRPDGSTIEGPGFIVNSTSGDLANNELQEGSMQLQYSGALTFGLPT